jgi:hypothetical protein
MLALSSLLLACDGSGRFTQSAGGKKTASAAAQGERDAGTTDKVVPPPATPPTETDDAADQPVQITGTYLTCAAVEPPSESHAVYGCKLARQGSNETVDLRQLVQSHKWTYELLPGSMAAGTVDVKEQPDGAEWQVFYELAAEGLAPLQKLVDALKVELQIVPFSSGKPGGAKPSVISGLLSVLANGLGTLADAVRTATTAPPGPAPAAADPAPPSSPSAFGSAPSTAAAGDSKIGPTLQFRIVAKGGARFGLMLSDPGGISDLGVRGDGSFQFLNATVAAGGDATVHWATRLTASFKRGSQTCTGTGVIGSASLGLPTFCN